MGPLRAAATPPSKPSGPEWAAPSAHRAHRDASVLWRVRQAGLRAGQSAEPGASGGREDVGHSPAEDTAEDEDRWLEGDASPRSGTDGSAMALPGPWADSREWGASARTARQAHALRSAAAAASEAAAAMARERRRREAARTWVGEVPRGRPAGVRGGGPRHGGTQEESSGTASLGTPRQPPAASGYAVGRQGVWTEPASSSAWTPESGRTEECSSSGDSGTPLVRNRGFRPPADDRGVPSSESDSRGGAGRYWEPAAWRQDGRASDSAEADWTVSSSEAGGTGFTGDSADNSWSPEDQRGPVGRSGMRASIHAGVSAADGSASVTSSVSGSTSGEASGDVFDGTLRGARHE